MNPLIKYWQFTLLGFFILLSLGSLLFFGLHLGIDFKGGTLYQVELQKQVSSEEIARIANIISQRIDPGGLRGDVLSPVGGKYIMIQTAETDPQALDTIEARIRQQGKFEAVLEGKVLFTGDEIKKVLRRDGYGVAKVGNVFQWNLPFILNDAAAIRFAQGIFHECSAVSVGTNGAPIYECKKTTFFLDKPNALIVMSQLQYDEDARELSLGNTLENIPQNTSIETLILDANIPVLIYNETTGLDAVALAAIKEKTSLAIVTDDLPTSIVSDLNAAGFTVQVQDRTPTIPWIWEAVRAQQIIQLSEGITNLDVADRSQAKIFSQLSINGSRENAQVAFNDLEELAILLESGSLPTPVKSISKETISASLGKSFLNTILLMGAIAIIIIALVIIIKYHNWKIALAIFGTVLAEVIILPGILSLPFIRQPFDLAAFAGLIAALGSGVNAQIIIVEEMTNRQKRETLSLLQRVKNGLFIITTSAISIIGVMGPIVLFSRTMPGLSSLYGFAVVAILGALIGVIITRPAFTKIIELILEREENKKN